VRDSPISFRLQRASNNPTNLVNSQLQISRAIGNAAISVATAATGFPLSLDLDKGQPTASPEQTEAEPLGKRKVKAQQAAIFRDQALKNLQSNLISLSQELGRIDATKKLSDYPKLKSRLVSILKAHQSLLSPPAENDGQP